MRQRIRLEVSSAIPQGGDDDGLRKIIGGLKKAEDATQAAQVLAELRYANRVVAADLVAADSKIIVGAVKDTEYTMAAQRVKINPVHEADALYLGKDSLIHLDEVKGTPNAFRQKLKLKPDQLTNMKAWASADPQRRTIKAVIDTDVDWTTLLGQSKSESRAPLQALIQEGIPLRIGTYELIRPRCRSCGTLR